MLADDCAPRHAASLIEALGFARDHAESLSAMLADKPDPENAARLVQAIRNMLCAADDELDSLDDTQAHSDAVQAMRRMTDAELYRAITEPTPGYP